MSERHGLRREVQDAGAGLDGARPAAVSSYALITLLAGGLYALLRGLALAKVAQGDPFGRSFGPYGR